jgi:hypothetical protein
MKVTISVVRTANLSTFILEVHDEGGNLIDRIRNIDRSRLVATRNDLASRLSEEYDHVFARPIPDMSIPTPWRNPWK